MDILIKTMSGLEQVMANEASQLGASNVELLGRAVGCEGNLKTLYRLNLEARTALRVLMPIHEFKAINEEQLYREVGAVDWSRYMGLTQTLAVDAVANSEIFTHSQYVALKTKDAIVDQFRNRTGRRPSVDTNSPDLRINIHIRHDQATISLDSSGDSLHRRGYRQMSVEAPVNEVLAAGMILISGWDRKQAFIDPMCGSGTLPIEAAMLACNIPPQWKRPHFGFMKWKNFNKSLWEEVTREAESKILDKCPAPIFGYDIDMQAIRATRRNSSIAGVESLIHVQRRPFERLAPPESEGVIIMNPPYDERLTTEDIENFYEKIGDSLKKNFSGYNAWIISSHLPALKHVGLRSSSRHDLYNGALACKYVEYDLYEGSKKSSST